MNDSINHPRCYNVGGVEVIDAIWEWGYGEAFCVGNVIKYLVRYKHKNTGVIDLLKFNELQIEDLEKAQFYLDYVIEKLKERKG